MDNLSKISAAIILILCIMAGALALDTHAEDFEQAPQQEETTADAETVIDTSGSVQVADPALYAKLDKMQETLDKLSDALTVQADAEEVEQSADSAPDYSAQLSTIDSRLEILTEKATAETAETDAFTKPFDEYSVSEVLLLVLAAVAVGAVLIGFVRRL